MTIEERLSQAWRQRNQAIACAILSLVIALAVVMNSFLANHQAAIDTQQHIIGLELTLADTQRALKANQQELVHTQEALIRAQEALSRR